MAFIAFGAYGALLVGGYVLVRGVEVGLAWWRWERRVRDSRNRNGHVHRIGR